MGTSKTGVNDVSRENSEQKVLRYLEKHKTEENSADKNEISQIFSRSDAWIEGIVRGIVDAVDERNKYAEEYEKVLQEHNQHVLFDLSKVIENFCIDDQLYEQLSFREILVVGKLENALYASQPESIGGLCLDVQVVRGSQPARRINPAKDEEIAPKLVQELGKKLEDVKKDHPSMRSFPDLRKTIERIAQSGKTSDLTVGASGTSRQGSGVYAKHLHEMNREEHSKFLVHVSSQVDVGGKNGGSRITAWIDRNFHTLEERRTEYLVENPDYTDEKSLYIGLQAKGYYVKHKSTDGNISERNMYSLSKARGLVGEGSTFLLMRYMAIVKYSGQFELSTIHINGDMCRNIYACNEPEEAVINNKTMEVCKIYRTIIEECGINHISVTVLTLSGQIMKHEWKDCNVILMVNPLVAIIIDNPKEVQSVPLKYEWEKDMQLFSNYLDKKVSSAKTINSYISDHPELKNMIGDYVQSILHMKPRNILDFTISHFTKYAPVFLPKNEYFQEAE